MLTSRGAQQPFGSTGSPIKKSVSFRIIIQGQKIRWIRFGLDSVDTIGAVLRARCQGKNFFAKPETFLETPEVAIS